MTASPLYAWLAVSLARHIGPATFLRLLQIFNDPQSILGASSSQLVALGLAEETIADLQQPAHEVIDRTLQWLSSNNAIILSLYDENYPVMLRHITDPPPLLYVVGDPAVLRLPQLAIVGSRNPTPAGEHNAQEFAAELTRAGMVITSGLALGIDAAAHRGALQVNGKTIAVLGTGVDRIYPESHRALALQIVAQGGAVISEFPIGTPPWAGNFPRRNRIISGMCKGVLVVEAALKSGSLITARHALDQGREVYAIPGSIHNTQSKGCHLLLRQGAKLVENIADILEELPPTFSDNSDSYAADGHYTQLTAEDSQGKVVMAVIEDAPTPVDHIIERCGLTPDAVCSILLLLELQGKVQMTTAGHYCRAYDKGGR